MKHYIHIYTFSSCNSSVEKLVNIKKHCAPTKSTVRKTQGIILELYWCALPNRPHSIDQPNITYLDSCKSFDQESQRIRTYGI